MDTKKIACAATALMMTLTTGAFAQGRDGDRDGRYRDGGYRDGGPQAGQSGRPDGGRYRDRGERPGPPSNAYTDEHGRRGSPSWSNGRGPDRNRDYRVDHRERGAGPSHDWYRGSRLPSQYRGRQYVVDDWRGHRLSAPPRGYQWVQAGSDYVLVAIATGIIAQLLLNN